MTCKAALINRQADDSIAWLCQPLAPLAKHVGAVSAKQFLAHAQSLAEQLPQEQAATPHCINLCANRYLFMVAFCAAIIRQHTNLLPANKNPNTQTRLAQRYSEPYIVHDGLSELADNIKTIDLLELDLSQSPTTDFNIPDIDFEQIAAITFTSGSTGESAAIIKTWHTFVASTEINKRYMLPNQDDVFYHLATVPSQHMWGLETTVLLALLANVCVVDAQPLYPSDIFSTLMQLPAPRCLVTTPLHLRAINVSETKAIAIENTLIATAPLSIDLAKVVEDKLNTQIREVYGCSEVGSMAVRRPTLTEQWRRFDGLQFNSNADGETVVSAEHLPDSVCLDDLVTMLDQEHFILAGRKSDQINIAGKRGSLLEVNNVLMKFAGLIDGVVIFPEQQKNVPRLVALVVLPADKSKDDLRRHFSDYLDAAFVPRPILVVDSLPRQENGKLIKQALLDTYRSLVND